MKVRDNKPIIDWYIADIRSALTVGELEYVLDNFMNLKISLSHLEYAAFCVLFQERFDEIISNGNAADVDSFNVMLDSLLLLAS